MITNCLPVPATSFNLRGRTYGSVPAAEPAKLGRVDKQFLSIPQAFYARLPLRTLPAQTPKKQLLRGVGASFDQLRSLRSQAHGFLEALLRASIDPQGVTTAQERAELVERKLQELRPQLPQLPEVQVEALPLEKLALTTSESLHAHYQEAFWRSAQRLAADVLDALDRLVARQMVGLVEFFPGDACRYYFFRSVVEQTTRSKQITDRATVFTVQRTTRRSVQETHRAVCHVHELLNTQRYLLPATGIPKPERVLELMRQTPDWLRHNLELVAGDQVRETVVERDVATKERVVQDTVVFHRDPALVLCGHYVLAAWDPAEVGGIVAGLLRLLS